MIEDQGWQFFLQVAKESVKEAKQDTSFEGVLPNIKAICATLEELEWPELVEFRPFLIELMKQFVLLRALLKSEQDIETFELAIRNLEDRYYLEEKLTFQNSQAGLASDPLEDTDRFVPITDEEPLAITL